MSLRQVRQFGQLSYWYCHIMSPNLLPRKVTRFEQHGHGLSPGAHAILFYSKLWIMVFVRICVNAVKLLSGSKTWCLTPFQSDLRTSYNRLKIDVTVSLWSIPRQVPIFWIRKCQHYCLLITYNINFHCLKIISLLQHFLNVSIRE